MSLKQTVIRFTCLALVGLAIVLPILALAEQIPGTETGALRYSDTSKIVAELAIDNGTAICSGNVRPNADQDCSITITLYKKNTSSWSKVKSWTGSAKSGATASAGGSVTLSQGTYKVESVGKVSNETSTAQTASKTY